jgi:hypothetical protein
MLKGWSSCFEDVAIILLLFLHSERRRTVTTLSSVIPFDCITNLVWILLIS